MPPWHVLEALAGCNEESILRRRVLRGRRPGDHADSVLWPTHPVRTEGVPQLRAKFREDGEDNLGYSLHTRREARPEE